MTRFAWLQSRAQFLLAAGLVAVLAVVAAVTGVQQSHLFHTVVAPCGTDCGLAINRFLTHDRLLDQAFDLLLQVTPALVGLFWGAPLLARELESGSFRLAWTQSVSRTRWLVARVGIGAAATVLTVGALTLAVTWWDRARDRVGGANPFTVFDRRDIVPIAYALFAFALGTVVGAALRRTLPAMAGTLVGYVVARIGVAVWARPHLMPPVTRILSLIQAGPKAPVHLDIGTVQGGVQLFVQGNGPPRSWTLSNHLVDASGHRVGTGQLAAFLHDHCATIASGGPPIAGPGPDGAAATDPGRLCLGQVARTFRLAVSYQPEGRYWTFQCLEAGIFVALGLICAAACWYWVAGRGSGQRRFGGSGKNPEVRRT